MSDTRLVVRLQMRKSSFFQEKKAFWRTIEDKTVSLMVRLNRFTIILFQLLKPKNRICLWLHFFYHLYMESISKSYQLYLRNMSTIQSLFITFTSTTLVKATSNFYLEWCFPTFGGREEKFCSPEEIWQGLEKFVLKQLGRCSWYLAYRGQRCYQTSYNVRDSPLQEFSGPKC